MSTSEATRPSSRKHPPVTLLSVALFFGLVGVFRVTQSPQFDSYRTLDVIQLVVSGASLGVALFGFMVWLLRPRW